MKFFSCLVLCLAAVLPTAFSDVQNNQNYEPILPAPYRRSGEDFDTLLGHSFGTSKRQFAKKNFDEIDAAGFNDFSKRNFDEIDNAGFKDYLGKRNFDEIDAAGFNDFSKRTYSNDANAINAANDKLAGDGGDAKYKRNFDEIDAAGFNDFSKRKEHFDHGFDACQCKNDDMDRKYGRIKAFLHAMKQKILDDLAPYHDEYKNGKFGNKDEKYNNFLSYLLGSNNGHGHYNPAFGKYGHYYPASKRGDYGDYSPYYRGNNFGKYDMHPYYSSHYTPFHPFYFPVILDKNYVPPSFSGFLPNIIKYYKQKYGQNMGHYAPSKYPAADKPYYRGADYDQHTTYPKTNP